MTKIETQVLKSVAKANFTFRGDPIFSSYRQAAHVLNAMVRKGLLVKLTNQFGSDEPITDENQARYVGA